MTVRHAPYRRHLSNRPGFIPEKEMRKKARRERCFGFYWWRWSFHIWPKVKIVPLVFFSGHQPRLLPHHIRTQRWISLR